MIRSKKGFTFVEVLVVVAILAVVVTGLIRLFVYCSDSSDMAGNKTLAVIAAQTKLEEIRDHNFASIVADYSFGGTPGNSFALIYSTGNGNIYLTQIDPNLLEVEVVVSFENKRRLVIGEDQDLDGVMDVGEDVNTNGKLDSVVTLSTLIAKRY